MILHAQAVVRGTRRALVVVELPFGTYEENPEAAFRSAARVMRETGCGAIKVQGGRRMTETIRFLTERGIPVLAHVGMLPQASHIVGGYAPQGHDEDSWPGHIADATAAADAGAFALMVETVVEPLAQRITEAVNIPTIGMGASAACDGQILVLEEMLGLSQAPADYVKVYADLRAAIEHAVRQYADEVREHAFPGEDHVFR